MNEKDREVVEFENHFSEFLKKHSNWCRSITKL